MTVPAAYGSGNVKPVTLAVGCAAALVGWSNAVLPRMGLGPRARAAVNVAFAVGLSAAARTSSISAGGLTAAELGWHSTSTGLRWGGLAAAMPALAYPVALAVPAVRARIATPPQSRVDFVEWVTVRIPLGTVLAEELAFRSVLYALARRASPRWAPLLGATAFGLWHVKPARVAGDPVWATVAVTAVSSLLFDWLRGGSGSVIAPALLHLSVNAGGAAAGRLAAGRLAR